MQGATAASNPLYMGLHTVTWHLSSAAAPTPAVLNQVLAALNAHLVTNGSNTYVLCPCCSDYRCVLLPFVTRCAFSAAST